MDFNGVIINDEPVQMRAYQEVLKDEGIDLTEDEYFGSLGMDDRTFVAAAFERARKKVEDAKIDEIAAANPSGGRDCCRANCRCLMASATLSRRCRANFHSESSAWPDGQRSTLCLKRVGWLNFFPTVVSAADVSKCKPDPECFQDRISSEIDSTRTSRDICR